MSTAKFPKLLFIARWNSDSIVSAVKSLFFVNAFFNSYFAHSFHSFIQKHNIFVVYGNLVYGFIFDTLFLLPFIGQGLR